MDTPRRVGETRPGSFRQPERPNQERRHLPPGDYIGRTKQQRIRRAAQRHTQLRQPLRMARPPHTGVHIAETRCHTPRRIATIESAHQPHRHHPTLQPIRRTEQPLGTLRTRQHPRRFQDLDSRRMSRRIRHIPEPRGAILSVNPRHPTHLSYQQHQDNGHPTPPLLSTTPRPPEPNRVQPAISHRTLLRTPGKQILPPHLRSKARRRLRVTSYGAELGSTWGESESTGSGGGTSTIDC